MASVLKKLGYKGQTPALVLNVPKEYGSVLMSLAEEPDTEVKGKYPFIHFFAKDSAILKSGIKDVLKAIDGDGICWISYPKGSSHKYHSDLNRDGVRSIVLKQGFETVSLIAVDDDWSAMRVRKAEFAGSSK